MCIKRIAIIILIFAFSERTHFGSTVLSTERIALEQLSTAMRIYSDLHQGSQVTDWRQVREVFDLAAANKNLRGKPSYPLEDHYQFVTRPLPTLDGSGQVLLIRRTPLEWAAEESLVSQRKEQWRYMVTRNKNGVILATRVPENEVQAMLRKAGMVITPKIGLPKVDIETPPKNLSIPPDQSAIVASSPSRENLSPQIKVVPKQIIKDASASPTVSQGITATPKYFAFWWIVAGAIALILGGLVAWKRGS